MEKDIFCGEEKQRNVRREKIGKGQYFFMQGRRQKKLWKVYLPIAPKVAAAKGPDPGINNTWMTNRLLEYLTLDCFILYPININDVNVPKKSF